MSSNFDDYSNIQIGNETFNFGGGVVDADGKSPAAAVLDVISKTSITKSMGSLERLVSESYKFIRLADDINDMKNYINDMRVCFVALTISGYVAVLIYAVVLRCTKRNNRRGRRLRHSSPSAANYDEEAMGWTEKQPVMSLSHQTGPVGGGCGAGASAAAAAAGGGGGGGTVSTTGGGGAGGRMLVPDRDTYHYRSSGRRTMQPFTRQRYHVTAPLSDVSKRHRTEDSDPTKINGPMESFPLTETESSAGNLPTVLTTDATMEDVTVN